MHTWQAAAELAGLDDQLVPDYLDALEHPDALSREHRPDHLTASGIVLCGRFVLLVLHRKVGLWLQPGGHVAPDDPSLAAAALREATEETGLPGLVVDPVPLRLDRHRAPCGARDHLDVQFVVRARSPAPPVVSAESVDVRWFEQGALPDQRVDLRPLVSAAMSRR